MAGEVTVVDGAQKALAIIGGDLKGLSPQERVDYYVSLCEGNGLDWRTKPYEYIDMRGKVVLYLTGGGAAQIASIRGVSTEITHTENDNGNRVVRVRAWDKSGRSTESSAYVPIEGLKGENYGNACMKCETKAKRRAIIALTGMTTIDESELETTPARAITVDHNTGEIMEAKLSQPVAIPAKPSVANHVKVMGDRIKAVMGSCTEKTLEALLGRSEGKPSVYLTNATPEQLAEVNTALDALENPQPVTKDVDPFEEVEE